MYTGHLCGSSDLTSSLSTLCHTHFKNLSPPPFLLFSVFFLFSPLTLQSFSFFLVWGEFGKQGLCQEKLEWHPLREEKAAFTCHS